MSYRVILVLLLVLMGLCDHLCHPICVKRLMENTHFFRSRSQFRSVVVMDETLFKRHVIQLPRNFSILVEFTMTEPGSRCSFCRMFNEEFTRLANRYRESRSWDLFFVTVEFRHSESVFRMLKMETVPRYVMFTSGGKTGDHRTFTHMMYRADAEMMARNVRHITGIQINVNERTNASFKLAVALMAVLGLLGLQSKHVRAAVSHRLFWALLSVAFILLFSSGTMLNYIQSRPFAGRSLELRLENYVDKHGQYVVESILVCLLYGLSTACVVTLHTVSSLRDRRPLTKYGLEVTLGVALLVLISVLVKIYRLKDSHFPYRLLFK